MAQQANVSLCMIVKNEGPRLAACLSSWRPFVKEIVIVDTGSTDDSEEVAKRYSDVWERFTDCNDSEGRIENFAMARQKSLDLATQPWIIWSDGDDVVEGAENLFTIVTQLDVERNGEPMYVAFPYSYAQDALGNSITDQYRERLATPKEFFKWRGEVHEVLVPQDASKAIFKKLDNIRYVHKRGDKVVESGRNLRIIKKMLEKYGESDARHLYYAFLEYFNNNQPDEAIRLGKRYLELSGWDHEKALCSIRMAQYYISVADYDAAIQVSQRAIVECEDWCEPYLLIAKAFYLKADVGIDPFRNYQKCVHFAKLGLSYPPTQTLLFINPMDRNYDIHRFLNIALSKTGDVVAALESAKTGLLANPTDPHLICNRDIYQKHLSRLKINEKMAEMVACGGITQEQYAAVMRVFDGGETQSSLAHQPVPSLPIATPSLTDVWAKIAEANTLGYVKNCHYNESGGFETEITLKPMCDEPMDIVFFMGVGLEWMNPRLIKQKGCGASESLLSDISKRLSLLGHKVRVYAGTGLNGEGVYDGVEWLDSEKYHDLDCDVLVVSRYANMLNDDYKINAKLKLLWCHDVIAVNATNNLLLNADRVLALTNWHKQYLMNAHNLNSAHVLVTRNGIDLNHFKKDVIRNPFKVVNCSSPDRSYKVLIECWADIKAQVPEAELHLFYGLNNMRVMAQWNQNTAIELGALETLIESVKDQGVVHHGRVSQEKLAEELLSAGVWAYPNWFEETYSVAAASAQAAGLRIVCSANAALNEVVADRGVRLEGDSYSAEYKKKFVEEVVIAMRKEGDEDRVANQKYADEHFGLDSLAVDWITMFNELIEEKKENPTVPYMPTESYR